MNIEPGTHVQIVDGPFNNFAGVVQQVLPGEGEAVVEIVIFGRKSSVNVSLSHMEGYVPGGRTDAEIDLRRKCYLYRVHLMKKWWLQRCADSPQSDDLVEEYASFLLAWRGFEDDAEELMDQFAAKFPADMSDEDFAARWKDESSEWLDQIAFERLPLDEAMDAASKRQDKAREAFEASGRPDPRDE